MPVTNKKTPDAKVFYDDKAKQVQKNTGRIIGTKGNMEPTLNTPKPEPTMGDSGATCPKCGTKLKLVSAEPAIPVRPPMAPPGGAMDESSLTPDFGK